MSSNHQRASVAPAGGTDEAPIAFGLGWHMAELYHFEQLPGEHDTDDTDGLPGIGHLSRKDRAHLLVMQIAVALEQLGHQLEQEKIGHQVEADPIDVPALKQVVRASHDVLLKTLTARDAQIGKAYGLGRALAETMLLPTTQEPRSFAKQFGVYRMRTVQAQLADVRTSLPRYAAEAVEITLDSWSDWVAANNLAGANVQWTTPQKRQVGQCIRRQGDIWYGLLIGEIDPLRLLCLENYDTAAKSLLAHVTALAWSFLITSWIGRVLGVVSLILILLLLGVAATGHLAAVTGTAILVLGALGITAGGMVTSVRQVLGQVQAPLWEAELKRGIGVAALYLPKLTVTEADD